MIFIIRGGRIVRNSSAAPMTGLLRQYGLSGGRSCRPHHPPHIYKNHAPQATHSEPAFRLCPTFPCIHVNQLLSRKGFYSNFCHHIVFLFQINIPAKVSVQVFVTILFFFFRQTSPQRFLRKSLSSACFSSPDKHPSKDSCESLCHQLVFLLQINIPAKVSPDIFVTSLFSR